jgi:four helix bundle protein
MTKVRRFEDLICWQKSRQLANIIYDYTAKGTFAHDYKLRDQIQGAAGSVMHNIAEGSDSGTDLEFIRFRKMARRSASEVQSELYLAVDRRYILMADLKKAYDLADESKRLINGLIMYLRRYTPATNTKISEESLAYVAEIRTDLPADYFQAANDEDPDTYQTDDYKTIDYKTGD